MRTTTFNLLCQLCLNKNNNHSPLNSVNVRYANALEESDNQQRKVPTVHVEEQEYVTTGAVGETHRQQTAQQT